MTAYWSFKTVRKEITSKPLKFHAPAITICDSVTRRRTNVCQQSPDDCIFLDHSTFCREYPLYCNIKSGSNGIYKGDHVCKEDCPSWLDMYKKSNFSPIPGIRDHNLIGMSLRFKSVPFTTNDGEPMVCFTYGSTANLKDIKVEELRNISTWLSWILVGEVKAYDNLNTKENASLYFVIHDSRRKVNPFREGFKLNLETKYRIFLNEEVETIRFPSPYDTNCTDYLKDWRRNNGSGPLTTLECIDYCQFSHYLKEKHCIPRFLRISHDIQLCNSSEIIPLDLVKYCIDQCGAPCLERNYKYEIRKIQHNLPTFILKNGNSPFFYSQFQVAIQISFRNYHLTKIVYEPSIIMMDIFSNLGGYLGIWLGVSLLSFMDLLYLLCVVFVNKCQSFKKKLKIRARSEMQ